MTARERWEQALRDAWRASIDLDDATANDIALMWQISRTLGHDACDQIVNELHAERDRVSRSQPPVVGTVESQDRETPPRDAIPLTQWMAERRADRREETQ